MEKALKEKMEQKISEIFSKKDEIYNTVNLLDELASEKNSFSYGLVIGRLYNSFYYQTRRILKRSPTEKEFSDFLQLIKEHESNLKENLKF